MRKCSSLLFDQQQQFWSKAETTQSCLNINRESLAVLPNVCKITSLRHTCPRCFSSQYTENHIVSQASSRAPPPQTAASHCSLRGSEALYLSRNLPALHPMQLGKHMALEVHSLAFNDFWREVPRTFKNSTEHWEMCGCKLETCF